MCGGRWCKAGGGCCSCGGVSMATHDDLVDEEEVEVEVEVEVEKPGDRIPSILSWPELMALLILAMFFCSKSIYNLI